MPLTEAQTVDLSKLIGENYPATRSALPVVGAALSADDIAAIEAELVGLIAEYAAVETKHLRLSGGKDGVDLDYERNRTSVRQRARILLGLPPLSANDYAGRDGAMQLGSMSGGAWL